MLKRMGIGLFCCLVKEVSEIAIQSTMVGGECCHHFDNNTIDSCYFLSSKLNLNGTCLTISNLTDNYFHCCQANTSFLLLLIPGVLEGLFVLLVFMTALKFVCAQAPLRLKGLLVGVWYALLAIKYLLIEVLVGLLKGLLVGVGLLKGLLVGVWYALLTIRYLLFEVSFFHFHEHLSLLFWESTTSFTTFFIIDSILSSLDCFPVFPLIPEDALLGCSCSSSVVTVDNEVVWLLPVISDISSSSV